MESVFSALGALIKAVVFAFLAILMLLAALLCYFLAAVGLIIDLLILILSMGKSMAGVAKAFARAGNYFLASIQTVADQFFDKVKEGAE